MKDTAQFEYRPRIADRVLEDLLSYMGAILIEGPKWCGKTTTADQFAKSKVVLRGGGGEEQGKELAQIAMGEILKGNTSPD